jgi:hypothetical protein
VRPYDLEKIMLGEYPLLSSASVTRVFPDGMRIAVTERKKIILWCVGEPASDVTDATFSDGPVLPPASPNRGESVGGQCFFVDESGIARDASRALLIDNRDAAIFIIDMSGKPVAIGEKVFDSGYGTFVVELNEMFTEQLGIELVPHLTTVSRFANEVRAKTREGWEIYFGTDISIHSSLDALKLLFEKELPKELRAKLAYIDLRTENRVYYAFRTEENTENSSTISSVVPEEKVADTKSKKKNKK